MFRTVELAGASRTAQPRCDPGRHGNGTTGGGLRRSADDAGQPTQSWIALAGSAPHRRRRCLPCAGSPPVLAQDAAATSHLAPACRPRPDPAWDHGGAGGTVDDIALSAPDRHGLSAAHAAAHLRHSTGRNPDRGVPAIKRGDVAQHRAWMIRAYAIALAAGTQALTIGVGEGIFGKTVLITDLSTSAGWIVNLAVAEVILRRPSAQRPSAGNVSARGGARSPVEPRSSG